MSNITITSLEQLDNLKEEDYLNVTSIILPYCNFKEIPKVIFRLTNLKWLNLWGNQITTLPEDFFKLPKLEWLDLRKNQLTTIPDWLKLMKNKGNARY